MYYKETCTYTESQTQIDTHIIGTGTNTQTHTGGVLHHVREKQKESDMFLNQRKHRAGARILTDLIELLLDLPEGFVTYIMISIDIFFE
jgi:hypothetical protein